MTPASFSIPFSSILEGTRARDLSKYGNIEELALSLGTYGTIQPIVLSLRAQQKDDPLWLSAGQDVYDLVAGGRRYRAMQLLGTRELWHGSTLDPAKLGFLFADEVPEDIRRGAELEENLRRLSMDWIDETLTIADLHVAKTRKDLRWTQKDTAKILGFDSHFMVSIHTTAAKLLRGGDEDVKKCKDITAVVALLARRKEEEALREVSKRMTVAIQTKGGDDNAVPSDDSRRVAVSGEENVPSVSIPLSSVFRVGDSIELMRSLPDASFSHIVTDIPYGIDMDNLDAENVAITVAQHDVKANIELMSVFLPEAFRLIKPHGFCCFFFDLDHLEKLQTWAAQAGFRVQRWPIIIHKTSPCKNSCAQYNTTKNYEALLYLRRDEHSVLRRAVSSSVRSYDFLSERSLYAHPFYKPSAAWSDIYDDVAFAGQSVLDPFCGELSGARAAISKGLVPHGFDLEESHILRGMKGVKDAYVKQLGEGVRFT